VNSLLEAPSKATHLKGNIWKTSFRSTADATLDALRALFPPLIEACLQGPIILISVFPEDMQFLDPRHVPLWVEMLSSRKITLERACVVTNAPAVRIIAIGFAFTVGTLGMPLELVVKKTLEEALVWAERGNVSGESKRA
jgi:hypothetical protein